MNEGLDLGWVITNQALLATLVAGHAIVLGLSVAVGIVVGLPLGYLLAVLRTGRVTAVVLDLLSATSVLGLLLLAPLVRGTAIDDRVNLIMTFSGLAALRIARAVVVAYRDRPAAPYAYARAAGLGVGTRFRLDLNYLAPRVLATLGRVAVATVVLITLGGVIVSARFGPGGELGSLIYRGLDARDLTQTMAGVVLVAALALVADLVLRGLRRILIGADKEMSWT